MKLVVPRDTLVIADTHGSLPALIGNLRAANAINAKGDWDKPGCDLVLMGDQLFDRHIDDIEVLDLITRLRAQVKEAGGECILLAGNHEMTGIDSLAGTLTRDKNLIPKHIRQYMGLWVFAGMTQTYGGFESPEEMMKFRNAEKEKPGSFLEELKLHFVGRQLIDHLTSLQLVARSGSVIFTHTPPVPQMTSVLSIMEIDQINGIFQSGVRSHLKEPDSQLDPPTLSFDKLVNIFLNANNRAPDLLPITSSRWAKHHTRSASVNTFVFGHDRESAGIQDCPGQLRLVGLDRGFGLIDQSITGKTRSAAWLYTDGTIEVVTER